VNDDEYFRVTVFDYLFSLPEQASFLDIEGFIFLALLLKSIFGKFPALTDWVTVIFV
jgi:hypothetical protein